MHFLASVMNHISSYFRPQQLAMPACASMLLGLTVTALLLFADRDENWLLATISIALTTLLSMYLQVVSDEAGLAKKRVAAGQSEIALFQEILQNEKNARNLSFHALQLQDRAIELSAIAVSIYDATREGAPLLYVNQAFEELTGNLGSDVMGKPFCDVHADEFCGTSLPHLRNLLVARSPGNLMLRNWRKDGSSFWSDMHVSPVDDSAGNTTHFVVAQTDITALKIYEEQALHSSRYDALTGLANRWLFRDKVSSTLLQAVSQEREIWILFLGLDRFKLINESSGHDVGDRVLKIFAERLTESVGTEDTISRFGGDEFVVLLKTPLHQSAANAVIERIMALVALPISLDDKNIFMSCSVGVSVFPTDGSHADALIQHADTAMHCAKCQGPNSFQFSTPQLTARALERSLLEVDLRVALEQEQLFLHYQPQVDLRSGLIVGMEALLRWNHPSRGNVPPADFIGLAEETGMIIPIGAWVIQTACRQMKQWLELGFSDLRVSVNLSAKQFSDRALIASIAAILDDTGLDGRFLELELTESLVMTDVNSGFGILQNLKAMGISLAIDDFGTGYSSLAYLKRLPIDTLKIDRSFVSDITYGIDDAVIVTSIISLAHNLRLSVVAEGVETSEQLSFLQLNGCDEIQGFRFSRPVSAADFTALLVQRKSLPPYPGEVLTETGRARAMANPGQVSPLAIGNK